MFRVLHEVAQQREFVIVYYHTEATWEENSPGIRWIRNAYEEIPMQFKQNVKVPAKNGTCCRQPPIFLHNNL
jgi:hypothetical protein